MTHYIRVPSRDQNGHRGFTIEPGVQSFNLEDIMDFDHVVWVDEKGDVHDDMPNSPWEPVLEDGGMSFPVVSDGDSYSDVRWELVDGYSGQSGYRGPIMHSSEYIGGDMADHILSTPGWYVALINDGSCTDECDDPDGCETDHAEGWAVAFRGADW